MTTYTYAHWTADSNGTPYCTACGKGDRDHPKTNCRVPVRYYLPSFATAPYRRRRRRAA